MLFRSEAAEEQPVVNQPDQGVSQSVLSELQALRDNQQALIEQVKSLKAEKEPEKKEPEFEQVEFVKSDEDIRRAVDSPEGFNSLLNKVYQIGAAKGREMALQNMPEIVQREATTLYDRRQLIANFYSTNPELAPHAEALKNKAIELASSKVYSDYRTLLEDTEKAIRSEKNIPKVAPIVQQEPKKQEAKAPLAFPGGKGGTSRKPAPAALSKAQKDMEGLFD